MYSIFICFKLFSTPKWITFKMQFSFFTKNCFIIYFFSSAHRFFIPIYKIIIKIIQFFWINSIISISVSIVTVIIIIIIIIIITIYLFECPWKSMISWAAYPPIQAPKHRELINPLRQQLRWQLGMCTNHVVFSRPVISHRIMAPRWAQYSVWCSWGNPTGVSDGMKDGIFTRAFQTRGNKWPHSIPSDSACASAVHHVAFLSLACLTGEFRTTD